MDQSDAASELKDVLDAFFETREALFARMTGAVTAALGAGRKILLFGNGGSAAEAQHFAAELVNRFQAERRAIPAVALPADLPGLTAVAEDQSFDQIFAHQVRALGRPGDVAVALSTSGESANVVEGLKAAKAKGMITVAFTGEGGGRIAGPDGGAPDYLIDVPSRSTPRIQEAHLVLLHILAGEIERRAG
jgi:D-sedoheptulose 7-phosphate isomerase